jgi:linoleoyl-CoA desaturase
MGSSALVRPDASAAAADTEKTSPVPHFARTDGFQAALRSRVDDFFRRTGLPRRDCPAMFRKTLIVLSWMAGSYALLLFAAGAWWLAVPLAISLALSMAAVGMNVQHDAGHNAFSDRPWLNRLMALTLDLIGASSYVWRFKHHVVHHTFVNITGHDTDIDLGALGRLSPHQRRLPIHRFQQWYLWPLYGLLTIKWNWVDDFKDVLAGHFRGRRFPRPRGWDLLAFLAGKANFFLLAVGVPLLLHPVWAVVLFYGLTSFVLGLVLSVVFQLAHCVEGADFPLPEPRTNQMENEWAVHQVETAVDFAPKSRVLTWMLGGLNFQIEHHLLPAICHIHYPRLAPLVEQTCREYGVRYTVNRTLWAGIVSHYRWLRRMGQPCPA